MRKLSLLLSFIFFSTVAFTQKIDLDKLNFKASYLQLPTNPFPQEYTTFSTKFIANGINLNDAGYSNNESDLESVYFKISGFKRVTTGGHFTIKVQIDGYDMGKPVTEKKEEKTKDKDGKETITTSYRLTFKYLVPMMYTITDLNGKILKDGPVAEGSLEKTYETSYYSSTTALEKYWNDNAATTKRGLLGGFISEKLSLFQARLDSEIGYVPRINTDILWTTDSPKHPENDAFKKACEDAKLAMAEMTVIIPLNLAKVKPIIAYFDSVLVKYAKDEKPERKLRYGAWYNMATIYYWLEDFDNAIRCSEGLIANDYDKKDGQEIKTSSERLKAKLASGIIKTRHYVRDVTNAVAPEMTQAQKDEEAARQNALKDKAMREAAEREAISQRQSSRSSSGMVDVGKSINAIGGLLGGAKYREKQKQREDIREMSESLKSMTRALQAQNGTGKIEDLNQAIQSDSTSKSNYIARANYFWRNSKYNEAVKDFTKASSIDPDDPNVFMKRGFVYVNSLEQFENAVADFTKAIDLSENKSEAYRSRAYVYWKMQDFRKSIEDYKKITELEPQNANSYLNLGNAYFNLSAYDLAANTYSEVIKITPNAESYNLRGWALTNDEKYQEALLDFNKAIELNPYDGKYFKNRGNVKNKLGQYSSAIEDLDVAIKKKIDLHYKSLSNKGDSYFGLEKYKEALEYYQEALKIKPDFQEAIDGKQKAEAKLKN